MYIYIHQYIISYCKATPSPRPPTEPIKRFTCFIQEFRASKTEFAYIYNEEPGKYSNVGRFDVFIVWSERFRNTVFFFFFVFETSRSLNDTRVCIGLKTNTVRRGWVGRVPDVPRRRVRRVVPYGLRRRRENERISRTACARGTYGVLVGRRTVIGRQAVILNCRRRRRRRR